MALAKTCNANLLINALQRLVDQHGDQPVYIQNIETGNYMSVGFSVRPDAVSGIRMTHRDQILILASEISAEIP